MQAAAEFLAAKGWTLVGEYTEVESGKRKDRPRLAEAIEATKRIKGKLVTAKLDRLARNVHFISGLMETGVDFVAVDMPTADRFMLHVYATRPSIRSNPLVRTRHQRPITLRATPTF